ncbi:MAG: hypothetical protein ACRDT4_04565 [Micromonosporaceae bacterium]
MSEIMVRVLGEGDFLVPAEQGEQLRERLAHADTLSLDERNAAVRELIAEVIRDGTEAPKGSTPDLVLTLREAPAPAHPPPPQPPRPPWEDDGTRHYRDPDDPRYDPPSQQGPAGGYPSSGTWGEAGRDIDPTDRPRG